MNKNIIITRFFQILILFVIVTILACKKSDKYNSGNLLGEWVSTDLVDTLNFTSNKDLFKNLNGISDHYTYNISDDSIRFEYSGILMQYIYIGPSPKYIFHFTGDNLTIDFRPPYLGFRPQIVAFNRK
jgi:hypothetical protein